MNIKKVFQPIIALLTANSTQTVADILDQATAMCATAQGAGSRSIDSIIRLITTKETLAVFCQYHQRWELVSVADYNPKTSAPSGLASSCREGAQAKNKAAETARKSERDIFTRLDNNQITNDDIPAIRATIRAEQAKVLPRQDGHGYDSREEAVAALEVDPTLVS